VPLCAYLSGAIEYAPDHGKAWRALVAEKLIALGHTAYDPALDEKKNLTDHERDHFRSWKRSDLPRFQQVLRKIIAYDLDQIEQRTDYIICYWDEFAQRGAGTQAELTFAHRLGIPVYLIAGMPVEQISGWILGCSDEVFTDFESFTVFLSQHNFEAERPRVTA